MHMLFGSLVEDPMVVEAPGWLFIGLLYVLEYWPMILGSIWGGGTLFLIGKAMRRWYREDARDARAGARDEHDVIANMRPIAKGRRKARLKYVFTSATFWLPLLTWKGIKKVAYYSFLPVLMFRQKEQLAAIASVGGPMPEPPKYNPAKASDVPLPVPVGMLIEGENAVSCVACGSIVPKDAAHDCVRKEAVSLERPF